MLLASALPRLARGADLPHDLQRRPGAGAAERSASRCPRARAPSGWRSARSIPPRCSRSTPTSPSPGSRYDGAVDEASVLRRSVGRRVVFRLPESKDTISALVLGVDPLRLQLPDGRVTFTPPGAALYPGDVVVADPDADARPRERPRAGRAPARLLHRRAPPGRRATRWCSAASDARVTGRRCSSPRRSAPRDAEVQLLAGAVGRAEPAGAAADAAARSGPQMAACARRRAGRQRAARGRVPPLLAPGPAHAPAGAHHARSRCSSRPR